MPANYRRLAEAGLCDGDQLYRSLSSFKLVIEDAVGENFSKIEEECAKKCEGLAQKHSQCQGIEVRSDGVCVLFDRDFAADDQSGLENTTGASLQKQINHKFPGRHLTSVNSDPYIWEHLHGVVLASRAQLRRKPSLQGTQSMAMRTGQGRWAVRPLQAVAPHKQWGPVARQFAVCAEPGSAEAYVARVLRHWQLRPGEPSQVRVGSESGLAVHGLVPDLDVAKPERGTQVVGTGF